MSDTVLHGRILSLDQSDVLVESRYYAPVRALGIVVHTVTGTYRASILRPLSDELAGLSDDGTWYYSKHLCLCIVESVEDGFRAIESAVEELALSQSVSAQTQQGPECK